MSSRKILPPPQDFEDILDSVFEEFREKNPVYEEYQKPESPYALNEKLQEMITHLSSDFSAEIEREVLSLLNRIDAYPSMSAYQFSLSLKMLADCYLEHGITGNALDVYRLALEKNKNLPVRRTVSRLEKLSAEELVYSLDINSVYFESGVENGSSVGLRLGAEEYDPEFEKYIEQQLDDLGPSYRESFYKFAREQEFGGGFNIYVGSELVHSYREWALSTLKSFRESKEFEELHRQKTSKINMEKLSKIPCDPDIKPAPEELRLLGKINGKSSLADVPGYFTAEYKMDYQNALERLFASGLLAFGSLKYRLSKQTIPQLKTFLRQRGLRADGKKADMIKLLLNCITEQEIKELPQYFVATEKGIEILKDCQALWGSGEP